MEREPSEAMRQKRAVRKRIKMMITEVPPDERARRSRLACTHLMSIPEVQAAHTVLVYVPLPDELDVWPALHGLKDAGKRVILPKCRSDRHEVLCVEVGDFKHDLIRGTYNILEPKSDRDLGLKDLDVVVSPGRAFDRVGNRVGRGAGYYDRFFSREGFHAFICGIAFDCQVLSEVPVEPHDVPVDGVVTESGLIRIEAGRSRRAQHTPDRRSPSQEAEGQQRV
jgi:5-formyltetrahydrofolate cyclo-ligase